MFKKAILLFLIFSFVSYLHADKPCLCGSYANGIVSYTVTGTGCCTSKPTESGTARVRTYIENEGVWELLEVKETTSQAAQRTCCG